MAAVLAVAAILLVLAGAFGMVKLLTVVAVAVVLVAVAVILISAGVGTIQIGGRKAA